MKKNNKKGSWFVDNLGQTILMAIGIGVGIYFIWAYVLHGGGNSINKLQECGSLTGNNGKCKETCENTEYEFPDVGCKGLSNKCCVPRDENINGLMLPSGYGGDDKHDFAITSFVIDTTNNPTIVGCTIVEASRVECSKNQALTIPITVKLSSIGKENSMVFVKPLIVFADNNKNIKYATASETITLPAQSTTTPVEETSINIKIQLTAQDSNIKEGYLRIYPYAECNNADCQKSDSAGKGVLVNDESKAIIVKFI